MEKWTPLSSRILYELSLNSRSFSFNFQLFRRCGQLATNYEDEKMVLGVLPPAKFKIMKKRQITKNSEKLFLVTESESFESKARYFPKFPRNLSGNFVKIS